MANSDWFRRHGREVLLGPLRGAGFQPAAVAQLDALSPFRPSPSQALECICNQRYCPRQASSIFPNAK